MKNKIIASFALALALIFFGCSSGDDGGSSGGNNTSITGKYQVYYEDMSLYKGNGTASTRQGLYFGEVNNGIFSLNLSAMPENDQYSGKVSEFGEIMGFSEGITIDPLDAEIYVPSIDLIKGFEIELSNNNGQLMFLDSDDNDYSIKTGYGQTGFIYFSKDVSIKGNSEDEFGKYEIDIKGKKGWNKIYHKFKETYNCQFKTLGSCLDAVQAAIDANTDLIGHFGNLTTYGECLNALSQLSIISSYDDDYVCGDIIMTTDNITKNERCILLIDDYYSKTLSKSLKRKIAAKR